PGSGREDEVSVWQAVAGFQPDAPCPTVDLHGAVLDERNPPPLVKLLRTQGEFSEIGLALHVGLRQRWTLIRQDRFVVQKNDVLLISFIAQTCGKRDAGVPRSNDDDRL